MDSVGSGPLQGPVICFRCKTQKGSVEELSAHISVDHLGYRPFQCLHCPPGEASRATELSLKMHMSAAHPDKEISMMYKANEIKNRELMNELKMSCLLTQSERDKETKVNDGELEVDCALRQDSFVAAQKSPKTNHLSVAVDHLPEVKTEPPSPASSPHQLDSGLQNLSGQGLRDGEAFMPTATATAQIKCSHPLFAESLAPGSSHLLLTEDGVGLMGGVKSGTGGFNINFRERRENLGFLKQECLDDQLNEDLELRNVDYDFLEEDSNRDYEAVAYKTQKAKLDNQSSSNCPGPSRKIPKKDRIIECESVMQCNVCDTTLYQRNQMEHILKHLNQPLYSCPYCQYSSSTRKAPVKRHISTCKQRNGDLEVIDKLKDFQEEISNWRFQCFGIKRVFQEKKDDGRFLNCKICHRSVHDGGKTKHILHSHLGKSVFLCPYCDYGNKGHGNHIKRHIRCQHPGMKEEFIQKIKDFQGEIDEWKVSCFGPGPTSATLQTKDRSHFIKCQICGKSMHPVQKTTHILWNHLREKVLFCPYCEHGNCGHRNHVKRHIKVHHPDKKLKIVSKVDSFRDEIHDWRVRCFGPIPDVQLVDSSDYTDCKICGKHTHLRAKNRHIFCNHLRENVLLCPYCDYGNKGHRNHLKTHIRVHHPGKELKIVNKTEDFNEEIQKWRKKCFGDSDKSKRSARNDLDFVDTGDDDQLVDPEDRDWQDIEQGSSDLIPDSQPDKRAEGLLKWASGCFQKNKMTILGNRCRLCRYMASTSSKWQRVWHVQTRHLRKNMYFCPVCAYGDFAKRRNLFQQHFAQVHPNRKLKIVDKYEENRDEVEKMVMECFATTRKVKNSALKRKKVLTVKFSKLQRKKTQNGSALLGI